PSRSRKRGALHCDACAAENATTDEEQLAACEHQKRAETAGMLADLARIYYPPRSRRGRRPDEHQGNDVLRLLCPDLAGYPASATAIADFSYIPTGNGGRPRRHVGWLALFHTA